MYENDWSQVEADLAEADQVPCNSTDNIEVILNYFMLSDLCVPYYPTYYIYCVNFGKRHFDFF